MCWLLIHAAKNILSQTTIVKMLSEMVEMLTTVQINTIVVFSAANCPLKCGLCNADCSGGENWIPPPETQVISATGMVHCN